MLWQIVYSSRGFENNITIGKNGFTMKEFKKFFYCFVTVPSNRNVKYRADNVAVKRVYTLSGGNYWGQPSVSGVAMSLKEIFNKNFRDSWTKGTQKKDIESQIANKLELAYFNVTL
jgi:hypothetical protein